MKSRAKCNPISLLLAFVCAISFLAGPMAPAASAANRASYMALDEAINQVRDNMLQRTQDFTIYVNCPYDLSVKGASHDILVVPAVSEERATTIFAGDYLKRAYDGWSGTIYCDGNNCYRVEFHMKYKTTYEQEQAFAKCLNDVVNSLNLWEKSDYLKYFGIYEYICNHVEYDYDTYEADYSSADCTAYTAYSALMKGRAVCSGYSHLFYAMCKTMGLPVRIVSGQADGLNGWGDHAWNLVQLNGVWYQLDCTWDAGDRPEDWRYFIKGEYTFPKHVLDPSFTNQSFTSNYPLSVESYYPTDAEWLPVCRFRDVSQMDYYYSAVWNLSRSGVLNGTGTYTFQPDVGMNRAMFVTCLYRLVGSPQLPNAVVIMPDVATDSYYSNAAAWAASYGIVSGYQDGLFHGENALTQEQVAAMLFRYASENGYYVGYDRDYQPVSLVLDKTSDYAKYPMLWAMANGIIPEWLAEPGRGVSRGEVAYYLQNFVGSLVTYTEIVPMSP